MELIAHRAANRPADVAAGAAVADAVELDVHLRRGRLEVRHAKVIWPTGVLWEQWHLVREEPVPVLREVLAATGPGTRLWVDLKGFTPRLTRRVLAELGDRTGTTVSSRSWWVLRPARRAPGVRTVRSIGARWQLRLARLRTTATPDGHGLHERFATPTVVAWLRRRHPFVVAWGLTSVERIAALDAMGVDAVIADDLGVLAAARALPPRTLTTQARPPVPPDHTR